MVLAMPQEMQEAQVIIVGAGPAGLATSACLNRHNICNIVLERDDCSASLWKKRSYDRLKLHLSKQYCQLPYMPFPHGTPRYVPRVEFIQYLDNYVSHFGIKPKYLRNVEYAFYDAKIEKYCVKAKNIALNVNEVYYGKFLVVATGENSEGFIPNINGLDSFKGDVMHSSLYENGKPFVGKQMLVVGCGNSGMEIAYDLSKWNAKTSICIRNPVHIVTKDMVWIGMFLLRYLPVNLVDKITILLSKITYGNLSIYGLQMPKLGPFSTKMLTGRSPTIDVGCVGKIKNGEVRVFPAIKSIEKNVIEFENGQINCFDAIIFATGYKSTVNYWLKDEDHFFSTNGMPMKKVPEHWRGKNGIYCAGFSRQGIVGCSSDAKNIAEDIMFVLLENKRT